MSKFRPRIRSRHPSHEPLRTQLPKLPIRTVVRLGSTTVLDLGPKKQIIEINTVEAVKNSANKLLMKHCFDVEGVKTADWWVKEENNFLKEGDEEQVSTLETLPYPIVAKHIFGSRGTGNYLINNQQELEAWLPNKTIENYIFEKFYNFNREYRLHVTKDGCFYTCRKLLREDTPTDKRWFRNDSNCNWIVEENESFDKPVNWDAIVAEGVKALKAVGLDFGAVDIRVQSATKTSKKHGEVPRENPEFIIIEINSAPSFGEITLQRYLEQIPNIVNSKIAEAKA